MTSTAVLFIALILTIGLCVLIAVLSFKHSAKAIHAISEAYRRNQEHTEDLLDRLMSMDFNTYKAYTRDLRVEEELEPEPLPPREEIPVLGPDLGGFGSRLGLRAMGNEGDDET